MTPKQQKFCDEYLISGNATQAAIKAGYSSKTAKSIGQRLLTYVDLKQYIESELDKLHSVKIADAQEVLEYLTAVMRGEKTVNVALQLKAAELIGKRYGIFSERINVDGIIPVVITGDDQLED